MKYGSLLILGSLASRCAGAMAGLLGLVHFLDGAERDLLPGVTVDDDNILVRLEVVAAGLPIPTDMAVDGLGRLFVCTRDSEIYLIDAEFGGASLYLDAANESTVDRGDVAMTAIAFHPDFAVGGAPGQGRFYTIQPEGPDGGPADFEPEFGQGNDHQSVVYEYRTLDERAEIYNGDALRELMRVKQPIRSHNLNDLVFDRNGWLYIATGDGGNASETSRNAESLNNVYGKILRIDPLGMQGFQSLNGQYSIPAQNPFSTVGSALGEIWVFGLRNPYRISLDHETDYLYIGDVGQDDVEEINRILVTAPGNVSFGWNRREGSFENSKLPGGVARPGDVLPLFEYDHQDGASVTGGYVYRGSRISELAGKYVFGDYQGNRDDEDPIPEVARLFYGDVDSGKVFEFRIDPTGASLPNRLLSIGQDGMGELYVLGIDNLLRIVPAEGASGASPDRVLWAEYVDLGAGWLWSTWFGVINDSGFPWINHREHGWMWVEDETTESVWLWTEDLGWMWTAGTIYSFLYRLESRGWLFYLRDSADPRWFLDLNTRSWLSIRANFPDT